jgi:hypothetical protein
MEMKMKQKTKKQNNVLSRLPFHNFVCCSCIVLTMEIKWKKLASADFLM